MRLRREEKSELTHTLKDNARSYAPVVFKARRCASTRSQAPAMRALRFHLRALGRLGHACARWWRSLRSPERGGAAARACATAATRAQRWRECVAVATRAPCGGVEAVCCGDRPPVAKSNCVAAQRRSHLPQKLGHLLADRVALLLQAPRLLHVEHGGEVNA